MGRSQVVRQWTLTPSFVGSSPTAPVLKNSFPFFFFDVSFKALLKKSNHLGTDLIVFRLSA